MRGTLFGRLLATNLLIILVALLVTGLVLTGLVSRHLMASHQEDLIAKGRQISQIISDYVQGDMDEATATSVLSVMEGSLNARLWVVDRRGIVMLESMGHHMEHSMRRSWRGTRVAERELPGILDGQVITTQGTLPQFPDVTMQMVGVPIYGPGERVQGGLFLLSPVIGIRETTRQIQLLLLASMLLAGLVAAAASYKASRSLSGPLENMERSARAMADGDFTNLLPEEGVREIRHVSRSLNYLARSLDGAMKDLRHERARFADLITGMSEGVLGFNKSGALVTLNPAAESMLGVREREHSALPGPLTETVNRVLTGSGGSLTVELEHGQRNLLVHVSPISREDTWPVRGAVALVQDVSERYRLEKIRRELLANVSHDLRTPLTAIRAYVEPLIDGTLEDPQERSAYLEIIRDESLRMERLLKDLMDMSRLEAGTLTMNIGPVDTKQMVRQALDRFGALASARSVELVDEVEADTPPVLADENRGVQVLTNLLDNAIKYAGPGGRVTVGASQEDDVVSISVSDDGPGISEEHLDRVFERFYKADRARSHRTGGAGLGLAIVKQLVEEMGGSVAVESHPGVGTVFRCRLRNAPTEPTGLGPDAPS